MNSIRQMKPRTRTSLHLIIIIVCLSALTTTCTAAELKQKTTAAFDKYVTATEARLANELRPGGAFLYIDNFSPRDRQKAYEQLKGGEILAEKITLKNPEGDVPDGMVHHWVGMIFIPGVTLA